MYSSDILGSEEGTDDLSVCKNTVGICIGYLIDKIAFISGTIINVKELCLDDYRPGFVLNIDHVLAGDASPQNVFNIALPCWSSNFFKLLYHYRLPTGRFRRALSNFVQE